MAKFIDILPTATTILTTSCNFEITHMPLWSVMCIKICICDLNVKFVYFHSLKNIVTAQKSLLGSGWFLVFHHAVKFGHLLYLVKLGAAPPPIFNILKVYIIIHYLVCLFLVIRTFKYWIQSSGLGQIWVPQWGFQPNLFISHSNLSTTPLPQQLFWAAQYIA